YPTWESLRIEDAEDSPAIVLTVKDRKGNVVRRLIGPVSKGFHRVEWDLRYARPVPTSIDAAKGNWQGSSSGMLALPGTYTVQLSRYVDGKFEMLSEPQKFKTVSLGLQTLPVRDIEAQFQFQKQVSSLQRAAMGLEKVFYDTEGRLKYMKQALVDTPKATELHITRVRELQRKLQDVAIVLLGDKSVSSRFEPIQPSLLNRINRASRGFWSTTGTTATHKREYQIALELFTDLRNKMDDMLENDLNQLEEEMERIGAPWTPGRRIPELKK
ncbi:MAG: glycosyl hydrolase, partial [Planctomycetota bacterium]